MGTGTGLYGDCRSTQCCVAVWYRRVEPITRLGGFTALKKTPEAPYTTKVNNRDLALVVEQPGNNPDARGAPDQRRRGAAGHALGRKHTQVPVYYTQRQSDRWACTCYTTTMPRWADWRIGNTIVPTSAPCCTTRVATRTSAARCWTWQRISCAWLRSVVSTSSRSSTPVEERP